jgi:hypothetical protein
MKICLSVLAVALQMCVPSVTQAATGTIKLVGSIVVAPHCQASSLGAGPLISCTKPASKSLPDTPNIVRTSVTEIRSLAAAEKGTKHQLRLLTVEYL